MDDIVLRTACPADSSAIALIYAHAVETGTASYELDPPDVAEITARMEAVTAQGYPYLVAERKGALLGYAYAGPFRARRAYRFMVEDSIYVAPDAVGRGIGRLLLQRLIADCRVLGFRQMVAVIGDGAQNRASVRLHEALGFEHAGVLKGSGFKHERWLDTVFMQLTLNGGTKTPPDPKSLPERRFRETPSGSGCAG